MPRLCRAVAPCPRGITLVEVLVALVVSALSLMAGLKLFQVTADSLAAAEQRSLALACADNEVLRVRLDANLQQMGARTAGCMQSNQTFNVNVSIQPTPHLNFRRLDVRVEGVRPEGRSGLLAERVVFLPVGFQ